MKYITIMGLIQVMLFVVRAGNNNFSSADLTTPSAPRCVVQTYPPGFECTWPPAGINQSEVIDSVGEAWKWVSAEIRQPDNISLDFQLLSLQMCPVLSHAMCFTSEGTIAKEEHRNDVYALLKRYGRTTLKQARDACHQKIAGRSYCIHIPLVAFGREFLDTANAWRGHLEAVVVATENYLDALFSDKLVETVWERQNELRDACTGMRWPNIARFLKYCNWTRWFGEMASWCRKPENSCVSFNAVRLCIAHTFEVARFASLGCGVLQKRDSRVPIPANGNSEPAAGDAFGL